MEVLEKLIDRLIVQVFDGHVPEQWIDCGDFKVLRNGNELLCTEQEIQTGDIILELFLNREES